MSSTRHTRFARGFLVSLFAFALADCGNQGASTPGSVRGTWGADCASPFIRIDDGAIHVFPDNADYTLVDTNLKGTELTLSFGTPHGNATETYTVGKNTLQLTAGHYWEADVVWHKPPMNRCKG